MPPKKNNQMNRDTARDSGSDAVESLLAKAFSGDAEAQEELRNQFFEMNTFFDEAAPILQRMAYNDHSTGIEGSYEGRVGEVASNVNMVRDRVIHIAGSIEKISEGDLSELDEYRKVGRRSDQDRVVPGFIHILEALQGLEAEMKRLITASLNGQLSERGKTALFKGAYAEVVRGTNNMLDAVINPLNMSAEYIERISRGDIPPLIVDEYRGDFNEIKNNLNLLIKAQNDIAALAQSLSVGDSSVWMEERSRDDVLVQSLQKMIENIRHDAAVLQKFADGNLDVEIKVMSEKDITAKSNVAIRDMLKAIIIELNVLTKATIEGKLDVRGDPSKFKGEYRKVIDGVNATLDALIRPLNVMAEYVDRIGKGNIPEKITEAYNGDFNEVKNNVNACIDGLQGLVEANKALQRMVVNDHTLRVNGTYQGVFAEVASATNAVQDRINHIAGSIEKISTGDLSEYDEYKRVGHRSDQDRVVPALTKTLETLLALESEMKRLTEASKEGKLTERGRPEQFKGAYAGVVKGTNDLLDAILIPIGEGNRILAQVSNGKIDELITQTYKGDHEVMKQNINNIALVLQKFKAEIDRLITATNDGKLDTRGNADQYKGAYGDVIKGINDLVNAFVHPLNVTAEYVDRISKGDIPSKITEKYNGDFNEIKNNINQLIDVANNLLREADVLVAASNEGKLDTRSNADQFAGGWRDLYKGINKILDAILIPIGEGNRILAQVSNGKIDELITQTYKGDHEAMKRNINNIAIVLQGFQKEFQRLTVASQNGMLSERGKPEQFK
ncbi:MAG: hypothetical protein NT074_08305, partial [Methanomicrobiales archaeon]|nr:hypothetical protein [Methanomicrobiales archaeon]